MLLSLDISTFTAAIPGSIAQGLIWGIMAFGVYITFRLLDFADLTVDGSMVTGGAVAVMMIKHGNSPWVALLAAFAAGMAAGFVTGFLHTAFGIPGILASILTQLSLYSINFNIMGKAANQAISVNKYKLLASLRYVNSSGSSRIYFFLGLSLGVIALIMILYWFFGTELGQVIRATGCNGNMARAQGINTNFVKVLALMISNGLVGLSGALYAQFQGASDVNMGRGAIVIGLASVIIGEVVFGKLCAKSKFMFAWTLASVVFGAVLYYIVYAVVIWLKMPTENMKLFSAVIVALFLSVPYLKEKYIKKGIKKSALTKQASLAEAAKAPVSEEAEQMPDAPHDYADIDSAEAQNKQSRQKRSANMVGFCCFIAMIGFLFLPYAQINHSRDVLWASFVGTNNMGDTFAWGTRIWLIFALVIIGLVFCLLESELVAAAAGAAMTVISGISLIFDFDSKMGGYGGFKYGIGGWGLLICSVAAAATGAVPIFLRRKEKFTQKADHMLELLDVHKVFNAGTINEKVALDGIQLQLNEGDFVTIIGGNGAGKSTTLNAIAGVWPIGHGKIVIGGTDVTKLPEHKRAPYLGRVFQDPMTGTAATMSIDENLALAARRGKHRGLKWGVTKAERAEYRKILAQLDLGLEDRLTTKVGLLSGGQRQAITLLMASLVRPDLLLLDEHTAALDPKTAAKVLELSDKVIQENGLTAMMVTHNMKDAIAHGNRLIMMHEGRIIYDVAGEEKKNLHVSDLLKKFEEASGGEFANDRMMLAN